MKVQVRGNWRDLTSFLGLPLKRSLRIRRASAAGQPEDSLRALMWRHVGVERTGDALAEALATVEGWCRYVLPRQFADPQGWQLQNMLEVARLMIRGAIFRDETRGVHFRADHPATSRSWRSHIAWYRGAAAPAIEPLE